LEWNDLPPLFPSFAEPERWLPLLQRHAELLAAAAEHTRVTSVESGDLVQRHYAESLEILRLAELAGASGNVLVDVGSGGGYPGMVIACVRPLAAVHLIEPLQKRARLLAEIANELGLTNVSSHPDRAEDAARGPLRQQASLVTARAVAALPVLLEYTAPFAAPGALLALPKGSRFEEELAASNRARSILGCDYLGSRQMRPEISESLSLALFRKSAPTPSRYPRKAGTPQREPL